MRHLLPVLGLFAATACATGRSYSEHLYRDSETSFRVGALPTDWRRVDVKKSDLVFKHSSGGTIFANGLCKENDDASLDVLTNHLLFDMKVDRELSREPITLDGRSALRTHVVAELDGVPVEMDIVVLKKDGCTYDMALIAGDEDFEEREQDFNTFVLGFEKVG